MPSSDLERIFGPGGELSRAHPHYEPRPGQLEMARAVALSLEAGKHLLVEAGTGTGKTLAYLVPAVLSGLRVVVSTGTKTLQDQIIDGDIPFIRDKLGLRVSAAAMKGRDNYLCLRRFREFEQEPFFSNFEDEGPFSAVRTWSRKTEAGDRAEVPGLPDEAAFWRSINARGDTCTGTKCESYEDCFLTRLKRRASSAQIVVVNHHLFFADLVLRQDAYGRVLPDHDRVIFDEAHLLEEIATHYLGLSLSSFRIEELVSDAERVLLSSGRSHRDGPAREVDLAAQGRGGGGRRGKGSARRSVGDRGPARRLPQAQTARAEAERFFEIFRREGEEKERPWGGRGQWRRKGQWGRAGERPDTGGHAGTSQGRFRFRPAELQPELAVAYERLSAALDALVAATAPRSATSEEAVLIERRATEIMATLRGILSAEEADTVTWAEARGHGVFLGAAPVDVSHPLSEMLFERVEGAVLTSATLSVLDDFSFARQRLGVGEADELRISSPFDYERQAVLYLPPRMPDPREEAFLSRLVEESMQLIEITSGRAFLLFTSFANLRRAREGLEGRLSFPIITQGEGSKPALLERFRRTPGAVLLGTSSFWHGVDVQGEALSLVVVDRLPFDVPGDPLVSARIERIQRRGGNPFSEYQLPSAVLELKQGLGRLIRSRRDRGVLAVLDGRLRTRAYGRVFLKSLPAFPVLDSLSQVRAFFQKGLLPLREGESTPGRVSRETPGRVSPSRNRESP